MLVGVLKLNPSSLWTRTLSPHTPKYHPLVYTQPPPTTKNQKPPTQPTNEPTQPPKPTIQITTTNQPTDQPNPTNQPNQPNQPNRTTTQSNPPSREELVRKLRTRARITRRSGAWGWLGGGKLTRAEVSEPDVARVISKWTGENGLGGLGWGGALGVEACCPRPCGLITAPFTVLTARTPQSSAFQAPTLSTPSTPLASSPHRPHNPNPSLTPTPRHPAHQAGGV